VPAILTKTYRYPIIPVLADQYTGDRVPLETNGENRAFDIASERWQKNETENHRRSITVTQIILTPFPSNNDLYYRRQECFN
jgi:hypothetical protein